MAYLHDFAVLQTEWMTEFMTAIDIVNSLCEIGSDCNDVLRATYPAIVSRPKTTDTTEHTIALVPPPTLDGPMIYRRPDCAEILKTKCVNAGEEIAWKDQINTSRPHTTEMEKYDDVKHGFTLGDIEDASKLYLSRMIGSEEYTDWQPWETSVSFLS